MDIETAAAFCEAGESVPHPIHEAVPDEIMPSRREELMALRQEITAAVGGVQHYAVPPDAFVAASHSVIPAALLAADSPDMSRATSNVPFKSAEEIDIDDADSSDADAESAVSDSSDTSTSSVSSDSNGSKQGARGTDKGRPFRTDIGDDDDDEGVSGPVRTLHEQPFSTLPIPPLPYLLVQQHQHIEPIGKILHVQRSGRWDDVEHFQASTVRRAATKAVRPSADASPSDAADRAHTVIIQGTLDNTPLDEGTLLALGDGRVFGCVEDVFGPIAAPLYLVRVLTRVSFDSADMVNSGLPESVADERIEQPLPFLIADDVQPSVVLYAVKEAAKYILTEKLRAAYPKGSDASNIWDEEIPLEEQEFSDDEAEQQAAESTRKHKRSRTQRHDQPAKFSADIVAAKEHATVQTTPVASFRSGDSHRHASPSTHVPAYPAGMPLMWPFMSMPMGMIPPASGIMQTVAQTASAEGSQSVSFPSAVQYQLQLQQQLHMQMMLHAQMLSAAQQHRQPPK
jgi:hypothetical protein